MPRVNIDASVGGGGENRPADVATVKARFIELGFNWLPLVNVDIDAELTTVIRLFQAIKNGLEDVDKPQNDGLIEVDGATHRWMAASNAPHWIRLPTGSAGEGFVKLFDGDQHDFGTDWLATVVMQAGASYRDTYMKVHPGAAPLTINDASLPHGGDTPDHAGHETGMCFDIKLPHLDGTVGGIKWDSPLYDREAMRAMLEALLEQPLTERVLFNDAQLIDEGLSEAHDGHDNHAHVKPRPPERQTP